jgi:hypothetical protein
MTINNKDNVSNNDMYKDTDVGKYNLKFNKNVHDNFINNNYLYNSYDNTRRLGEDRNKFKLEPKGIISQGNITPGKDYMINNVMMSPTINNVSLLKGSVDKRFHNYFLKSEPENNKKKMEMYNNTKDYAGKFNHDIYIK